MYLCLCMVSGVARIWYAHIIVTAYSAIRIRADEKVLNNSIASSNMNTSHDKRPLHDSQKWIEFQNKPTEYLHTLWCSHNTYIKVTIIIILLSFLLNKCRKYVATMSLGHYEFPVIIHTLKIASNYCKWNTGTIHHQACANKRLKLFELFISFWVRLCTLIERFVFQHNLQFDLKINAAIQIPTHNTILSLKYM